MRRLGPTVAAGASALRWASAPQTATLSSSVATATSARRYARPVDFSDGQRALSARTTGELLRGALILTACNQPMLVRNADRLLRWSSTVVGERITHALVRHTFFAHFVAGEDAEQIRPLLARLQGEGVGGILDYAAEADSDAIDSASTDVNQPARVFEYESEAQCDANRDIFLRAVEAVRDTTPEGFAAIKVTALGDPSLLERVSDAIVALKELFARLDSGADGHICREEFSRGWCETFAMDDAETAAWFDRLDVNGDGWIDAIEFVQTLGVHEVAALASRCRDTSSVLARPVSDAEIDELRRMTGRLDAIAAHASSLRVRLMVDAEHWYLQPAIASAVLRLQRRHNTHAALVFGTYQAYLTSTRSSLEFDLERAKREGWHFGAKLVRGAYLVHERERAAARGVPSPVHATLEQTHACFDGCIEHLLTRCPDPAHTSVMVASHNENSVARAAAMLDSGEASVPREQVRIAQTAAVRAPPGDDRMLARRSTSASCSGWPTTSPSRSRATA